jgi:WD40 repeat protein
MPGLIAQLGCWPAANISLLHKNLPPAMCCFACCHWLLLPLLHTQVCWSPFSPSHFLTASADWSVRLWSEAQPHSLWTFQLPTAQSEVSDVAFCPAASTLFAAAAGNTLQLWDIERSVMAPRATATRMGVRLTALAFSQVGGW